MVCIEKPSPAPIKIEYIDNCQNGVDSVSVESIASPTVISANPIIGKRL